MKLVKMAASDSPFCSDEELLNELRKLGYDDVSPEVFEMMKEDLAHLVQNEQFDKPSSESEYIESSPTTSVTDMSTISPDTVIRPSHQTKSPEPLPDHIPRKVSNNVDKGSDISSSESDKDTPSVDISISKYRSSLQDFKKKRNCVRSYEPAVQSSGISVSSAANLPFTKYRSDLCSYKIKDSVINNDIPIQNMQSADIPVSECLNTMTNLKLKENFGKESQKNKSPVNLNRYEEMCSFPDVPFGKYRSRMRNLDQIHNIKMKADCDDNVPTTDISINRYKNCLNNFKMKKNLMKTDQVLDNVDINENTPTVSISDDCKTIKRKVLRHRNGRVIITEEILEIPSILDTSYPSSDTVSSKSFSSDDLSLKSNGSTGSLTGLSPHSLNSSRSTYSLSPSRSIPSRVPVPRKKKSDPVSMYSYYRKFWDNFKPPGEKTHDKLRWAVRDRMLDYNL